MTYVDECGKCGDAECRGTKLVARCQMCLDDAATDEARLQARVAELEEALTDALAVMLTVGLRKASDNARAVLTKGETDQ